MDLIQSERLIIGELLAIYSESNFQNQLEGIATDIKIVLKNLLDDEAYNFQLVSQNSVRDLKYYSLVHRIKEPDSVKEKFYRSNLLQLNFNDFRFTSRNQVQGKRNEIKIRFKKCEDIIGVKILTDLNEDCKKVLSLLKNNEAALRAERIILDKKDLQSQPTKMNNGLEIYKIKGSYNIDYSFELQIKSKIVSAWGDMEHSIFYKDYFISPVKESTQATMNHIGKLLFQIDDFLVSVRNATKKYELNAEVIAFQSWFDHEYATSISQKLGNVDFKIDGFSDALFYIKNKKRISDNISRRNLHFDHLRYRPNEVKNRNYIAIRNESYDLKIFEAIIFSWFWPPSGITRTNIDIRFNLYFDIIRDFICDKILVEFDGLERRDVKAQVSVYFDKLLPYKPNSKIFLSHNDYIDHYRFMLFLKSEIDLLFPTSSNAFSALVEHLDYIYLNIKFKGNYKAQIADVRFSNLEVERLREILNHIGVAIKLKDKTEFEAEKKQTVDIINLLNEN